MFSGGEDQLVQRILFVGRRDWKDLAPAVEIAGYQGLAVSPDEPALREAFDRFLPDAIVVELGNDLLLLQHLRRVLRGELNSKRIPLLALLQKANLQDPQFVVGVDDFLIMPVDRSELVARLQMSLWRSRHIDSDNCIKIGGLAVDLARRSVTIGDRSVPLTPREFQLLQFLATHRRQAFPREMLLRHVWGYDFEGDPRVVDATIKRLRAKLRHPFDRVIETVRGLGYRLSAEAFEGMT